MSQLFTLGSNDYAKGLVVAVLAAVFTWLAQVVGAPGFDFATIQWSEVVRIAGVAALAYLAKNFATDDDGKVLGLGR
jgi:hypothetical protein